jgi:hypothetical protein
VVAGSTPNRDGCGESLLRRSHNQSSQFLPYPAGAEEIRQHLLEVEEKLLRSGERFIRQQVRKPLNDLVTSSKEKFSPNTPEAEWLNIYSIYRANQQLNEACNKLWSAVELANITSPAIWKKTYKPLGESFSGLFAVGATIPTLYYSEISTLISILSIFGVVPIKMGDPEYLVRCRDGWRLFVRKRYLQNVLGTSARTWHGEFTATYEALLRKGIALPPLNLKGLMRLRDLRNEVHYEILSDLKMWRASRHKTAFKRHLAHALETIDLAIQTVSKIKLVTTGCDERFKNLRENIGKAEL